MYAAPGLQPRWVAPRSCPPAFIELSAVRYELESCRWLAFNAVREFRAALSLPNVTDQFRLKQFRRIADCYRPHRQFSFPGELLERFDSDAVSAPVWFTPTCNHGGEK